MNGNGFKFHRAVFHCYCKNGNKIVGNYRVCKRYHPVLCRINYEDTEEEAFEEAKRVPMMVQNLWGSKPYKGRIYKKKEGVRREQNG